MTRRKQIMELERRVSCLERELDSLVNSLSFSNERKGEEITYEEVVDQWLNGKSNT